jgi:hypothetical protein
MRGEHRLHGDNHYDEDLREELTDLSSAKHRRSANHRAEKGHRRHNNDYNGHTFEEMQPLSMTGFLGQEGGRDPSSSTKGHQRSNKKKKNLRNDAHIDHDEAKPYAGFDIDLWLECANDGELDVYTCLGLSDPGTWSPDTRKLLCRLISALFIQLAVPVMLLLMEMDTFTAEDAEFSLRPIVSERKFRVMGSAMLCYSLYTMYMSCQDDCRASMLSFMLEQRFKFAHVWPLLLGEFANILVGGVLVLTMFISYTSTQTGTNLVLNSVAFNFLAGVDAEFVERETRDDAVDNFKALTAPYKDAHPKHRSRCLSQMTLGLLLVMRMCLLLEGCICALAFGILPDRHDESNRWILPFHCTYTSWWLA